MLATFLDRDGVISKETHLVKSIDELTLYEKSAEAIKILNKLGPVIVITNQPQVSRGLITEEELNKIHRHMIKELVRKNAFINAIYYCPHHPETHHKDVPNWARKYRVDCNCRKPKTGLLEKAAKDFSLDLKKCFFVGDSSRDILAGKNAGCKTILVRTGQAGNDGIYDVNPDYACNDIYDAALLISRLVLKKTM